MKPKKKNRKFLRAFPTDCVNRVVQLVSCRSAEEISAQVRSGLRSPKSGLGQGQLMPRKAYEHIRRSGTLPSPRDFAQEIIRVANDESSSVADVAEVVKRDPATASRLLKLVNSPLAGTSRRIASVPQAVSLLGLETVKSTAVAFSLVSGFRQGPCKRFDYERFWSESIATAVTARHLAHRLENMAPDDAFSCGLLCKIGRLAFATVEPARYAKLLEGVAAQDYARLCELELEAFGINHNELAAEMISDWSLPPVYCKAVRHQGSAAEGPFEEGEEWLQIAKLLHFAVTLSCVLVPHVTRRRILTSATQLASQLGIGPYGLPEVFDSVAHEWREIGPIFNVRTRKVPPLAEIYTRDVIED